MIYIRGVMLHPSKARLATVENLCNMLPMWFIQEPKARARCSGLIAVCPEYRCPEDRVPNTVSRIPSLGPVAQVVNSTTPLTGLFSGNRYT